MGAAHHLTSATTRPRTILAALLLVAPGVIWVAVFLLATLTLTDLRYLLRRGDFVPAEAVA